MSIVARDRASGRFGVAAATGGFGVGSIVPWLASGVGAVVTQGASDPDGAQAALRVMAAGGTAPDALRTALRGQAGADQQLAIIDAAGAVAVHMGAGLLPHSGHHLGEAFSVQANLMANDDVVPAMATAFNAAAGELEHRLLQAIHAGAAAGGDARGLLSAVLVVSGEPRDSPWLARTSLRVDHHPHPTVELTRLLAIRDQYARFAMAAGELIEGRYDAAGEILEGLGDADALWTFYRMISYWHRGQRAEAIAVKNSLSRHHPALLEVAPQLLATMQLPQTEAARVLAFVTSDDQ